ncbi:hypothetical protein BLNAU_23232 [Blattamonas nauphoetae]|uniref:Uncharacterized protein n=1 Tax=Blattamonas nauphoetae TaxID=2049346 RepID=A0ABQ9WUZ3_9EUKA|nr:hypothetical protein BLNAU_23232 [Blattamonas nauphoetae]
MTGIEPNWFSSHTGKKTWALVLFSEFLVIEIIPHLGFTSFQHLRHCTSLSLRCIVTRSFLICEWSL